MYNRQNNYNRMGNSRHIEDEQMYRDAVRNLRWNNGRGHGERWKVEDITSESGIDFNKENFTPYDYAYAVNSLYADYGNVSEKPEYYLKMGKEYLRNDSYPERGEERAYYDAKRRSRRYNTRYEYDDDFYEQPTNRKYKEYNTYRDRDNDGRYYE